MPKTEGYHHKNLKNELVAYAIELVEKEGSETLSLRRLAALCGVSYAAPYAHFHDKEEILNACRSQISVELTQYLEDSIASRNLSDAETLNVLGGAFVDYFQKHPRFYSFLFHEGTGVKVTITLDESAENHPPFEVFRKVCLALIARYRLSKEEGLARLAQCWALVHGVSSLMISPQVKFDGDWKDCI